MTVPLPSVMSVTESSDNDDCFVPIPDDEYLSYNFSPWVLYLGGLHILIQFPDPESAKKALTNNSLKSYFKSLSPWNTCYRITERVTWIAISGLPPHMWYPEPYTSIAKLWGDILLPEDCSSRQFDRSTRKVCILTKHTNLILETIQVSIGNEIFPIRVMEIEGEIASFFNGYTLESSDDDNTTIGDLNGWQHDGDNEGERNLGDDYAHSGDGDDVSDDKAANDKEDVNVTTEKLFLDNTDVRRSQTKTSEGTFVEESTSSTPAAKDKHPSSPKASDMNFGCTISRSTIEGNSQTFSLLRRTPKSKTNFKAQNSQSPSPRPNTDTNPLMDTLSSPQPIIPQTLPLKTYTRRHKSIPVSSSQLSQPRRRKRFASMKLFIPINETLTQLNHQHSKTN
ncbi:hypothetical protein CTI12_AA434350 [Artemisia annua]|uniref:DUF4283 domain-containing protein n=1 Tax=Artemisia annua TaxID=35608 RepID=A0A2U1LLG3_ARTAN|nr:hypothetical protein CTI12_AA434350 [Artemisia annua]